MASTFTIDTIEIDGDDDSSFISTEVALSVDHILEQIFDSLKSQDLLKCRLVSHRWLFLAQKPLQKQIELTFSHNKLKAKYWTGKKKYLKDLTALLKNGQFLCQDFEANGFIPIQFPCNKFSFEGHNLSNNGIQQFLNTNGKNIQELFLGHFSTDARSETILLDTIANVLLNQTPKLKNLSLYIHTKVHWETGNADRNDNSPLEPTDPEYSEISQKTWKLLQSKNGSSLKVLELFGLGLAKSLEFIIRLSPKLEEISLDSGSYKYLLVPENRLQLLKSLSISLDPPDDFNIEEIEIISRGNLRLREIILNFDKVTEWIQKYPNLVPRIVDVINRIFKESWDAVESIYLNKVTFLRGMKLPEVMPKVREIQIRDSRSEIDEDGGENTNVTVFPMRFNMQNTFPKLRLVHLDNYADNDHVRFFSSFLNCFHFGADPCDPLSTCVRRVTVRASCFDDRSDSIPPIISQRIQRWFPSARIELERWN